ncbi:MULTISPECIES: tRNA isopentenyl-2-thiomethyl-A-37 hydroxylase MiaE [Providencia]|uniref:tRNA isopentenyl-2-thiomethyl-A-37 hydroxylase MiaE n=1 Tax=Providencia rettgeri TaxID=587 RepID=A0A3R8WTV7_PRORE|nr:MULTISPECIES: tRNA isopentenyl-2-thiomethyl-A-37 hydroxylase MiaE [Providencia]ELR5075713.1 tRNA isopentenyl-2-thiomethyl-A-37 hydroxylase MiaE [Providencia stuartii]ELR5071470.1 tRNA isopentenyl-2-thiomethyl-A-37 hydroxylase MiaE [Providencia rettgeri]ELR5219531.1 tRNA isopentenyl-2-thiomethyl-A-37 hydroxylase MiaE [Providencia rettgeri]ELR5223379.1 tRNA isopentenyl-2-thiomethyl-A-37 hydroxylase MiaE [Providencia rettgeri]MBV2189773.1 tRNA isopentenyl-2-thiomethyl-A-37 hydroxylase MiaE [Pr
MDEYAQLLAPIRQFLQCETPDAWVKKASLPENLPIILKDHLLCELKAAQSAMFLIRKYAVDKDSAAVLLEWFKPYESFAYDRVGDIHTLRNKNQVSKQILAKKQSPYSQDLIDKMVLLIKEELHHFYQVLEIMHERNIPYDGITAGRYAKGLLSHVDPHDPKTLVDKLIIGAYIEARSCERFAKLAPFLDEQLANFYISLLRSEARHYQDYLHLAQLISKQDITERVNYFGIIEAELISTPDDDFKFHSGVPIN